MVGTMIKNISYVNFIRRVKFKVLEILYFEDSQKYKLLAYEGPIIFSAEIRKSLDDAKGIDSAEEANNLADFENTYKGAAFDIT